MFNKVREPTDEKGIYCRLQIIDDLAGRWTICLRK